MPFINALVFGLLAPGGRPCGVGGHLCSEEEIRSSKALEVSQKSALAELGGVGTSLSPVGGGEEEAIPEK